MAPGKKDVNQNEALSLDVSLKLATDGMHLFFRNQFQDAKALYEINCGNDPYSATGLAMLHVAHAFFTMEKPLIEEALETVNNTLKIVDPMRKPGSISGAISKWFTKTNYNDYTDVEAHAELLSLEMNFLYTVLSFMSEQSFTSLFKAARSSMSAHSSAKLCYQLMTQKTNWESDMIKRNFDVGSLVCWGMMNLLFSHLPARVVKIISLVGLPGNRDEGLECMKKATDDDMVSTMRHKMASFYVCMYSFYLEQMLGVGQLDIEWIKKLTDDGLRHFPDGAFDLYWAAKTYQLRGHCDKAIDLYQKSIDSQQEFKPIHSACRWDMLWCHAVQFDWQSAADLANVLRGDCSWSPCTNSYQYACFLYMIMEEQNRPELRPEIDAAMAQVAELRKRYAGKTLPPEKFAITMAERYNNGETELVLPALMLFYIWNVYDNSVERPEVLEPLLVRIEKKLQHVSDRDESRYVLLLLKGVCLRNMMRLEEAYDCFVEILHAEDKIKKENYVPPHAAFELGMTYKSMGNFADAKDWLVKARDTYTGFLIETLVHLRIHGALGKIKDMEKA